MAPVPPPTRPHSANPGIALNPSLFPHSSRPTAHRVASTSSFSFPREAEWEDAWDSSSDKEDGPTHPHSPKGVSIPTKANKTESSVNVASSWAPTSYQHVSPPQRLGIVNTNTYSEGATPPAPGTTTTTGLNGNGTGSGGAKLPPGGAWEIVETAEIELKDDEVAAPVKVGTEAVRQDVEEILNGKRSKCLLACEVPVTARQ